MIVGIDIGTSFSSVCALNNDGKAEPVYVSTGVNIFGNDFSIPSAVFIDQNIILVGQAAHNSKMKKPENFKSGFKSSLGQDKPFFIGDRQIMPEDLYREIFVHFKNCIDKSFGNKTIEEAWITYPACYNDHKKELIAKAAAKAGIFNVKLIDEPSAAARAFLMEGKNSIADGGNVLVYDFGGGTFDVAIMKYINGTFESLVPSLGLENCGGTDIDKLIFADILKIFDEGALRKLQENPMAMNRFKARLMGICIKVKHHLSAAEIYSEDIELGCDDYAYSISRHHFNDLILPIVDETISCTRRIIQNAGIRNTDIQHLLLVGGSSRIPLVREKLGQIGCHKLIANINAELAISMGAAYCGNKIEKNQKETQEIPEKPATGQIVGQKEGMDEEPAGKNGLTVKPFYENNHKKKFFNPDLIN